MSRNKSANNGDYLHTLIIIKPLKNNCKNEIITFKFFEATVPLEDCRDSKRGKTSAVDRRTPPVRP